MHDRQRQWLPLAIMHILLCPFIVYELEEEDEGGAEDCEVCVAR